MFSESSNVNHPHTIQLNQAHNHITIIRRWLDWKTFYFTVFTITWNSLIFSNFVPIIFTASTISLFMIPFLLVGVFLIYYTIAKWINRTYIFANRKKIIVRYQPMPCPWLGNKQLRMTNLKRLYSKKKVQYHARGTNISYEVRANTHTGVDKKLVVVSNREEALFIEQILENYFNIEDEPQEGEIGGPTPPNFWHRLFGRKPKND